MIEAFWSRASEPIERSFRNEGLDPLGIIPGRSGGVAEENFLSGRRPELRTGMRTIQSLPRHVEPGPLKSCIGFEAVAHELARGGLADYRLTDWDTALEELVGGRLL